MHESVSSLAKVIVWELEGRWAVGLRRLFRETQSGSPAANASRPTGAPLRVYEARTAEGCRDMLQTAPASVLIAELRPENAASLLAFLTEVAETYPLVRTAVVGRIEMERTGWLAREAGAAHTAWSLQQLQGLARMAARHVARAPQPPRRSFREQTWTRLPWARSTETNGRADRST